MLQNEVRALAALGGVADLRSVGLRGHDRSPGRQHAGILAPGPELTTAAASTTPTPRSHAGHTSASRRSSTRRLGAGKQTHGDSASEGNTASEGLPKPAPRHERYPHGDTSIQTYGGEAGGADRQAVAALLRGYYTAAAAGDGATACSMMAQGVQLLLVRELGRGVPEKDRNCAAIASELFKMRRGEDGVGLAAPRVTGLRVKGDKGFALLRSKALPNGEIPVVREGGAWKIGALSGSELP